jgi:hypothetical protein
LLEFKNLSNEKERIDFVSDMITFRQFEKVFTDDYFTATVTGIARGEVRSLNLEVHTKPYTINQTVSIPLKNSLLIGGGLGYSPDFSEFVFKADLNLITKKGDIWTFSVDSNQYYYISRSFRVFRF